MKGKSIYTCTKCGFKHPIKDDVRPDAKQAALTCPCGSAMARRGAKKK